jgi:zinc transporter ZupT
MSPIAIKLLLGLTIPAALIAPLAPLSEQVSGSLISMAAGVLAYLVTVHLLPEARAPRERPGPMIVFTGTISVLAFILFQLLQGLE